MAGQKSPVWANLRNPRKERSPFKPGRFFEQISAHIFDLKLLVSEEKSGMADEIIGVASLCVSASERRLISQIFMMV